MPTLFTMTVDTEEEWEWGSGWPTTDLSVTNIGQLPRFQGVCSRYGVATTYFTDQAVLDNPEARQIVLELSKRERVEIGMHIHPWNTPPLDESGPVTPRKTFLHNLPEKLILAKLNSVHGRFVQNGLEPTSFRGGRYSSYGKIHDFLRDKRFLADASVVPYTTWSDDGAPDYREWDLQPVRVPPRHLSEQPLWVIPLTLGFTRRPFHFWRKCYALIEKSWLGRLRLIGMAERLGVVRKSWLNFEDPLGEGMLTFLKLLRRLKLPCICLTVHSSSLVAGKGPYTRTQADENRLFAQLEEVFGTLAKWPEFQPATVSEVAVQLEQEHHACTRN
jgi:hypothetical protein